MGSYKRYAMAFNSFTSTTSSTLKDLQSKINSKCSERSLQSTQGTVAFLNIYGLVSRFVTRGTPCVIDLMLLSASFFV